MFEIVGEGDSLEHRAEELIYFRILAFTTSHCHSVAGVIYMQTFYIFRSYCKSEHASSPHVRQVQIHTLHLSDHLHDLWWKLSCCLVWPWGGWRQMADGQ